MTLKDFEKKLTQDQDLVKKLSEAANPDEAYSIATAAGIDVSEDEFVAFMTELSKTQQDLSASDVDAIVGGASSSEMIASFASSISAAASSAGSSSV